ncbi:MAG: family 78 glycoside hydrolase catalytic domain [Kiritimatiellae bacterium]|nr:family 78 glycoside hydrolase catalytic domain [Kiritimatiellia bacterium]
MRLPVCLVTTLMAVMCGCCLMEKYSGAQIKAPYNLQVENLDDATGIDSAKPRFSWKLSADGRSIHNLTQHSYEVVVADSLDKLNEDEGSLWQSGRVVSEEQFNVVYAGAQFKSSQHCWWKVRVWADAEGKPSRWSQPYHWITGIMKPVDWKARWIGPNPVTRPNYDLKDARWIWNGFADKLENADKGAAIYHAVFEAPEDVSQRAMVMALTADDKYDIYINGKLAAKTWGHVNEWRWMRFIPVAKFLKPGHNHIAVRVTNEVKGPTGLLLNIRDGQSSLLSSGSNWKVTKQGGKEWFKPVAEFKDSQWKSVKVAGAPGAQPWGALERHFEIASPAFEKSFNLQQDVAEATLHISGLGFYEASLNGRKIGCKVLDPIPTKYDKRVLYSTYDMTDMLKKGKNTLNVLLGHGWYDMRSVSVWNFDNAPWRDFPRMIAQLEIKYEDGSRAYVFSDQSWRQVKSPIGYDCIREGVVIGKTHPNAPDLEKKKIMAIFVSAPKGKLSASTLPSSVVTQTLKPKKVTQLGEGHWMVDFGQNTAGWVNLQIKGQKAGDVVKLVYGERQAENGGLDNKSISAHFRYPASTALVSDGFFQTDHFICSGQAEEIYYPRFVYHGFQYVEITGLKIKPTADSISAAVIHTDFKSAGSFECSNDLLNKLQQATLWAYKSNFVNGYPTDCPHREKNGWTGDASLASELGMYNFHNVAAYEKWVDDLMDEQRGDGNVAAIIPTSGWGYQWGNGPAWDSAMAIVPWMLYVYKGDIQILERSYDRIKLYVDYMSTRAKDDLVYHGLSDWTPAKSKVPAEVTSSGYYYLDAMIVARIAELLGNNADAKKYNDLAERIKTAFNKKFYKGSGVYSIGAQTALSCALHQGVALTDNIAATQKALADIVAKDDCVPDFGILGSKYIFRSLSEAGRSDLAYKMLNKTERPSFGKWIVKDGATTLWEDWDQGSSRNHIMFGDFSAWMYQYLGGIRLSDDVSAVAKKVDSSKVAFKEFIIAPDPVDGLDWVKADHDSPYGMIRSHWVKSANGFKLEVDIPVNTSAIVYLPVKPTTKGVISDVPEIKSNRDRMAFKVGSGHYEFIVPNFGK